jgi:hypothetical protein|tara:strand:- start:3285 stop:3632 length:348 start_codon:yes stop_codon:yes gene_type:complete
MDERLEQALDFSNYMVTLNNQRRVIHEQFLETCVHYLNGGKFSISRDLITFCQTLRHNDQDSAILIDDNNTPVEVEDLQKFLDDILDIYFTTSYEYLDEYNKIKKNRKVEGLVNL